MMFLALINNVSLIIALSILYSFIVRKWKYGSRTGQAIFGLLFGTVAIVGMLNPVIVSPGLIFDGRSIIISIAGFIGGWITALIAGLMSVIYRTWVGGPGTVMGVSVIAASAAIGIVYHHIRQRRPHIVTPLHLIGFGIIVHSCMLALTMTLPSGMRYQVFSSIAIPVILIYPLGTLLVCVVLLDLESRILAEDALRESEDQYRSLFDNSIDAVLLTAPDGSVMAANPGASLIFGRTAEEICRIGRAGLIDPGDPRLPAALEERERTGQFRGELTFVRKDGTTFPGEISSVFFKDRRGNPKTSMIIRDVTERKQAAKELQRTLDSLRNAINTTIQVMVNAVEVRDPYTAGHQVRVADLARAIAGEMGLPRDRIEGIRLACSIHDIGKLSVPAEILSKPTKLSDAEFALIKTHSQKGYEILKDVESPWPLAQIVYQHHERMDGTGYPRNLKGDEILMEARIMAVADVVEAMASHRPYRPSLGLDSSLEEVEKNRGTLYDCAVADACLRLFRAKGFQLKSP